MEPYLIDDFYNPSSPYAPATQVRRDIEEARHRIASTIGGKIDDVLFTAGATESINLAMTAAHGGHIITSAIEHDSVLEAAKNYDYTVVPVNKYGQVEISSIKNAIRPDTQVISIALANHEIGTIQNLKDISSLVADIRTTRRSDGDNTPLWLHTDASQGVGQIDINVARRGVDMMTLNAGKIYGPKQVGLLWRRPGIRLWPIVHGGGQEAGLRSGTENVAGIIGFATALEMADHKRKSESDRLANLRDKLQSRLQSEFAESIVSGHPRKRLPGHLNISFDDIDAERLVFLLEAKNILVATGSACAANKGARSHVLSALGLSDQAIDGSLRLTLGRLNNESNLAVAADTIVDVIRREYERVQR